jgi:hypothetical protein
MPLVIDQARLIRVILPKDSSDESLEKYVAETVEHLKRLIDCCPSSTEVKLLVHELPKSAARPIGIKTMFSCKIMATFGPGRPIETENIFYVKNDGSKGIQSMEKNPSPFKAAVYLLSDLLD